MLSQGELGPECFGLEQTLHIMLSQREAEMRSETYQPDNKRPDEEQKKKLLVIAEICCPQEIKALAPLAHAINISFVLAYRHRNLWNITKCQRCFSVPPLGLVSSHDEAVGRQPGPWATSLAGAPSSAQTGGAPPGRTCTGAAAAGGDAPPDIPLRTPYRSLGGM